ncbi:MAG: glutamine-hydrolyzing carbamoyl-phosphate synthase small subunit [Ruminococcaceae bacterium]|nr:glutamine-hydrolyzing carbamoyl-phosphate synthase small subunit [Oscillospiraceae bacterium]
MAEKMNRKIVLEDGSEYKGYGFGDNCDRVCEIVFNTSMLGYQEIVSDPTYMYQMVVMTYPIIGTCGVSADTETKTPTIGGLIVREYNDLPSNYGYVKTLSEVMEENHIPGIYGLDTRKLTRSIRDNGCRKVLITSIDTPTDKALDIIKNTEIPTDAVSKVSCKRKWYSRTHNSSYNIVLVDCGLEQNIVAKLNAKGCNVAVVPFDCTAEEIIGMKPDGVFLSDGPGNPDDVPHLSKLVKELRGKLPIFGAGLGHQLVAKAYGASITKLKCGHRGANHPVKNLLNNVVEVTSQNHGFVVDKDSVEKTELEIVQINIIDSTVEGLRNTKDQVYCIQYQTESALDSIDEGGLFKQFTNAMKENKDNAKKK